MTRVMGIVNVTPDSFSDGGRYATVRSAVDRARQMVDEGVDVIDVGGESTRPGAEVVDEATETARVVPVIERVAALGRPVSVDTRKAAVAKAAIDAGATVVNDVSGGTFDPLMLGLVADRGVDVILMHMRGTPATMDEHCDYGDVVSDVRAELADRVERARSHGIEDERIAVDPGLGFAKTADQSLELVRRIDAFTGHPVVVGPSRKRFVGAVSDTPVDQRLEGTLAVCAWCAERGVDMLRVHDVGAVRRVVDMIGALRG